ncbi:ComEC family competence protein [Anatilimnocola aggregata]|uniref:ComEC family competence protein n=1 Tax=Anatilimnocola aggregata TaxID=2528021 RepID=A0A517Y6Y1_9BACT|nr:MBL fold metallo-hydrolase [Anatilimnocola aggregata]QDU25991.1 ComEC family competence protein [Anatilimnocola aggregata]
MRKTISQLLATLVLALAACGQIWAAEADGLQIYWIDTEGGAATLLITPTGETVLIDAGNPGRRDADRIVKTITEIAGRKQIDHLVTTHYHGDHFGGAIELAKLLPIVNLWDNGQFEGLRDDPGKAYFELKAEKKHVIKPGDSIPVKQLAAGSPELSIRCLGTRQQFVTAPAGTEENTNICATAREKARDGSDNANSIVLLIKFGNFTFFDAGDLTWNQEQKLVCPHNVVGKVDVYQVTHHGLDASNNPLVLQSIEPHVAIMNNGTTKGCAPEVFANLKETKSLQGIYQVHKNLRPDGATNNVADEFIANREKECQGNHIHLAVAADTKSYTVNIPANKHSQTYQTRTGK